MSVPPNYTHYNGKYYKMHREPKSFAEALSVCQADGATLIEMRDPEDVEPMMMFHGEA
jgi:hypothetical protein